MLAVAETASGRLLLQTEEGYCLGSFDRIVAIPPAPIGYCERMQVLLTLFMSYRTIIVITSSRTDLRRPKPRRRAHAGPDRARGQASWIQFRSRWPSRSRAAFPIMERFEFSLSRFADAQGSRLLPTSSVDVNTDDGTSRLSRRVN